VTRLRRSPQQVALTALCIKAAKQLEQVKAPRSGVALGPEISGQPV
jgi:hypothetical protein